LRPLARRGAVVHVHIIIPIIRLSPTSLWFELGVEGAYCQILLQGHTIPTFAWKGIMWWGYLDAVRWLLTNEVFKEGIDVHGAHPSLEAYRILLHLLRALTLVCVGRRNAQIEGQLRPCLNFFCIELANQLEQGPATEGIAVALWRRAEQLHQLGGVGRGSKVGVAV
jgi:hypothetical protein